MSIYDEEWAPEEIYVQGGLGYESFSKHSKRKYFTKLKEVKYFREDIHKELEKKVVVLNKLLRELYEENHRLKEQILELKNELDDKQGVIDHLKEGGWL